MGLLALLLHAALMAVAAPSLAGLLRGRGHPDQAWRDLRRLWRKPGRRTEDGALGVLPAVSLAGSAMASLLVPSFTVGMATAPLADLVILAGVLALSRAALVLGGFAAGTGPQGVAAQRTALLRLVVDPAVLVLILVLAVAAGSSNLDAIGATWRESGMPWPLVGAGIAGAVVCAAAMETSPMEMAPVTAFSGRDLAIVTFAGQLRLVAVLSVWATLLLPFGLAQAELGPEAWAIGAACWAVKVVGLGAAAALLGRWRRRLRADRAPELAGLGLLLALLAAALLFAGQKAA
ncbi:MAG: hypothetical protein NVSMB18_23410 [Acetobacteraceae bacterium]